MRKQNLKYNLRARSAAILFVSILSILIYNQAFFRHSHVLSNGKIITHAHPFDKKSSDLPGTNSHNHSTAEFDFISILDSSFTIMILVVYIAVKARHFLSFSEKERIHIFDTSYTLKGRAPPFILFHS